MLVPPWPWVLIFLLKCLPNLLRENSGGFGALGSQQLLSVAGGVCVIGVRGNVESGLVSALRVGFTDFEASFALILGSHTVPVAIKRL